jgi:predicted transcriptional regulator
MDRMKHETIREYIERRLDETVGQHSRIAKESGVPQSTVSRVYRREAKPELDNAQALIDWFAAYDRQMRRRTSAPIPATCRSAVGRVRGGAAALATSPLGK